MKNNFRFLFMKRILLIFSILLVITNVDAQKEFDLQGKGARAAGMGYAFTAIADDATAITWNPAGIVQLKKPEIAFEVSHLVTDYSHEIHGNRIYKPTSTIDYLGFVYPIKIKNKDLTFGVSYQNKMNFKANYYPNENSEQTDFNYKNNLTVNSISICGAYSIARFMGIGVSFNKWFSMGNKSDEYLFYYTKLIDSTYNFDKFFLNKSESFNYSGYNFTGGILVDFISFHLPLKLAVKYESKFTLKDDYDIAGEMKYSYENNVDTIRIEESKGVEKYYFPGIVTFGLSYRYGNYLTLACDINIKPFKDRNYTFDYYWDQKYYTNSQTPPDMDLTEQYHDEFYILKSNENLHQFRIGVEYVLHPKFGLFPIRIGWKTNPTSISSYNKYGHPVNQVYARSINLGFGIAAKHFSVDLAYERYKYDRMDINYRNEIMVYHIFDLSVIYYLK